MKQKRNLLAISICGAAGLIVAWFATAIPGKESTYEVEPWITVPEYRTDAARAIDAYERLMERHMDLTGKCLLQFGGDCQTIMQKLDGLDSRLSEVSARLTRIEESLGIEPYAGPASLVGPAEPNDSRQPK